MRGRMPTRFDNELLARARTENGLSQEDAARLVGVDVRTYRRYESGEVNEAGWFNIRHASRRRMVARCAHSVGLKKANWCASSRPNGAPV
jgi:Helix-turn-helix domain